MRFAAKIGLAALLLGVGVAAQETLPTNSDILFWSVAERDAAFRQMDKVLPTRAVKAGGDVHSFGKGEPIALNMDVDAYMAAQRAAGLIIVQDNKIRFEKYAMGYSARGRWVSFSVTKSVTSTLTGAAFRDGYIKSLDDKVSVYIPGLKGSVYDDVNVRQLLTMTSGVKWNEDYTDPKSDVAMFAKHQPEPGMDLTVSYMRRLGREAPPGTKWLYKTGETNLLGVLVSQATGKTLSQDLSEKIWKPYGMEQDATWLLDSSGHEYGGCCISATLRDFARFGQFIAEGATINGKSIVPVDWLAHATTKQADTGTPGRGYGYQWWTYDDGSFAALGIFGQSIFIDPSRKLVIATSGDTPKASDREVLGPARELFFRAVQAAVSAKR